MQSSAELNGARKAEFASRLRSIMEERGFSLAETVRRMGEHLPSGETISRASISQYRTGRALPRPLYLDALSLALGIEKSALILAPDAAPLAKPEAACALAPARRSRTERRRSLPERDRSEGEGSGTIDIRDYGAEVHLKIDQRVPWDIALKILEVLKRTP